jgi:hypothetical protein
MKNGAYVDFFFRGGSGVRKHDNSRTEYLIVTKFGKNVYFLLPHNWLDFGKNLSAGLPENQEKHAFFDPLFQKVGQNKDFSTIFSAIYIDLWK